MSGLRKIPIFIADAFSPAPFGGNPAAVCLLKEDLDDAMKQKIAAEMNLSETAFVVPIIAEQLNISEPFEKSSRFNLRWFTPTTEVPLCGHATLASAAVLFYAKNNQNELEFDTKSGILKAEKCPEMINGVKMKLPLNPPSINLDDSTSSPIWELIDVIGRSNPNFKTHHVRLNSTTKKLLIRLADGTTREDLEGLKIDKEALLKIDTSDKVRGIIITIDGYDTKYDFISRYFAPWVGIPEDPVTGSAHTVLVPYWSNELNGKIKLFARQSSPRGGELGLEMKSDHVVVKGQGTIVLNGSIEL